MGDRSKSLQFIQVEQSFDEPLDINLIMHQGNNENAQRTNCGGNCLDVNSVIERCKTSWEYYRSIKQLLDLEPQSEYLETPM